MHVPVLLKEAIEILNPQPGEFFIDGTLGEGGHAAAVLEKIAPNGRLLALDADKEIFERFKLKIQNLKFQTNVILINDNFMNLAQILKDKNLHKADGLLLDLGFSSRQLADGRGFSFSKDEPLLMTYKKDASPLKNILKQLSEQELFEIIKNYGEEKYAARIAKAIFQAEKRTPIQTSGELAEIIKNVAPKNYEHYRIHPATRTFMAFRIYINHELENLEKLLDSLEEILALNARIGIISFNSLEDRIIKHQFRLLAKRNILKILTKKPIRPSQEEIKQNYRSRSAKLRAAVKIS